MIRKTRNNIIYLIGNGFDLAHNLKTGYKDFILYYFRKCILSIKKYGKYKDDCIDIDVVWNSIRNSGDILDYFDEVVNRGEIKTLLPENSFFFASRMERPSEKTLTINPKNEFVEDLILNCLEKDWFGIEDAIFRSILSSHLKLVNDKGKITTNRSKTSSYQTELNKIKSLGNSVDCLKANLVEYLKSQNNPKDLRLELFDELFKGPVFKTRENIFSENQRSILFLNFNYTTYYYDLVRLIEEKNEDCYTDFKTISIHGSLEDEIDDIIFGIGDEQNEYYSDIETLYDDEWLKCMKSFHYLRKNNYQDLLTFIDSGNYEINIYGHSCSITDRTLLNMLFENENCKSINVFHHKGLNSYLKTSYNIARNFKDKVRLRKVLQPFNPSLKM